MSARKLEALPFGALPADVVGLVHRDGAVVLRNSLDAAQVARINAELGGPLEGVACGSAKTDAQCQRFTAIERNA